MKPAPFIDQPDGLCKCGRDESRLENMTPKQIAQRSAAAMWDGDRASKWFGIQLLEIDEAYAVMRLTVAPHHANGHAICHGGVTFALADSAFAFACNSRNQATVAQFNTITYVAPAHVGDQLTATAKEVSNSGRNGIYDVRVANQNGKTIAEFRGNCRAVGGGNFKE
jgi:acyl-CoA thioesterase